jgi:hypothetical protein
VDVIEVQLIDENEQHINVQQHEIKVEPFYVQVNQNLMEIVDLEKTNKFENQEIYLPSLVGNIVSSERVF